MLACFGAGSFVSQLIGGYLAAVLVFKAARGTAAAPWRALILIGYALVGALLTDLIAGPGIGAYSSSHFWPLLPCFWLVTSAVVSQVFSDKGDYLRVGTSYFTTVARHFDILTALVTEGERPLRVLHAVVVLAPVVMLVIIEIALCRGSRSGSC